MIQNWFRALRRSSERKLLRLIVDDNGFSATDWENQSTALKWDSIWQIRTYKRDLGTVDEICLEFRTPNGYLEVWESDQGYKDLVQEIERRFQLEQAWWSKVAFPAFATNDAILYRDPNAPPESLPAR
mgnify:CR=1 FL=1